MNNFDFPDNRARATMIQTHDAQMRLAEQWIATVSPYRLQAITGALGVAVEEEDTALLVCLPAAELEYVAKLARLTLHELVLRRNAADEAMEDDE